MSTYTLFEDDLDHVLAQTHKLWDELRGGRIFITGGTGFFGVWFLETFLRANEEFALKAEAVVLTRNPEAFARRLPNLADDAAIQLHAGDVRDFTFPAGPFTHVIHAATDASARLNEQSPLVMFDTIVRGTDRALEFASVCGCQKFLLTSSGAVYGTQPPHITNMPEDHWGGPDPQSPSSAYGEGKRVAEMLCGIYHRRRGLDTRIARSYALVGPYLPLDIHFAAGNFLRSAIDGNPIHIASDGRAVRSYIYAADSAIWLWNILFRGQTCRPYNVGSDQAVSIRELADAVAELTEPRVQVNVAKAVDPSKPPHYYVPNVERARTELGLDLHFTLSEALRRTLHWYQQLASVSCN